jgi:hypothetical protein
MPPISELHRDPLNTLVESKLIILEYKLIILEYRLIILFQFIERFIMSPLRMKGDILF